MALRLPKFQAGRPITEEVTAEKLNQIVDAIRQCELQSGVGYDVTRGPGGATLAIRRDNMIPSSQLGAAYVIGPPSTGVAQDGTLIGPGQPTPAWSVKRPGSDVFEPIYVFGENNFSYFYIATSCSEAGFIRDRYPSGIYLLSSDQSRTAGILASYQGTIYDHTYTPCAPCVNYTDPCDGDTFCDGGYRARTVAWSAEGANGEEHDGCNNGLVPLGNYVFRCRFDVGQISPTQIKLRFRLKTNVVTLQLNSEAAEYSPSGTFGTDEGFDKIREISEGFIAGENTFDIIVNNSNNFLYPSLKCQFEPTTAEIVSKNSSDDVANFSSLTDAQIDLIGLGTPVRALEAGTEYIWSYSGTGDKRSSASYTRLREA